jgi:hypothetical protein
LPSSFNTVRSNAWVSSTRPPGSVSGTVYSAGAVSWKPVGRHPRNPLRDDARRPSSRPGRLGNVRPIPIGYGSRPRLRGPANPARIDLAQEPLDFRRAGFSPALTLLMSAFALPMPPAPLTGRLHRPTECSATTPEDRGQISAIRCGSGPRDRPYRMRAVSRYSPYSPYSPCQRSATAVPLSPRSRQFHADL